MRRIILPLMAVALCATAAYAVLPRAHESYVLLNAQDDPAVLADIAVGKALSAPVARTEIENALNAGDPELAASFLELARDRGIVVAVGTVGMELQRKLYYEKELDFRVSRSYGPGRYDSAFEQKGRDYPIGHVR